VAATSHPIRAGDQEGRHGEAEADDQDTRRREYLRPARRNGNYERLTTTTFETPLPAFGARSAMDGFRARASPAGKAEAMPRAIRQAPVAQRF
jgi:hypothetical protein